MSAPQITRTDTDLSYEAEKGQTYHEEKMGALAEGDEGQEAGRAAYLASKEMEQITPEQNKRILRRIDWFVLPLFLLTQTLQYLDKTALNYAKVFGMEKALGLKGQEYAVAASIFYIGYLVAQGPWIYLIGRFPAGRVLGVSCFLWGISVLTIIANKNYTHVLVNRFFLGALEASVTPGLSLMTGFWYSRKEQPLRQTIWYSSVGFGGMIGALMAAGISPLSDKGLVPRWKLIFIILGSITVIWGAVLYLVLQDGPSTARFLKPEDRILATARVASNGTGTKSGKFDFAQAKEALIDPKAWLLSLAMFGSSVPNGILTNFSGPIIKGMGFSEVNAALLDCAGRSVQIITLIVAGLVCAKFNNMRVIVVTCGNLICVLGSGLMAFLPFKQTWPRLIGFWLINAQSVGFTLGLVMVSSNTGGYTKKSITSSMIFTCYCVGNAVGPQFVYNNEAPVYRTAAYAMIGSYLGKTVCHALLGVYMLWSNIARDKKYGPADEVAAADAGMLGMTEKHNQNFRYVL